jgi:hypothetical protein
MPCPCHAPTIPFFSRPRQSPAVFRRPCCAVLCCGLEKNGMVGAWHGHVMASVNQTRPHYVSQMGKTHSKPLAAQHGRGVAWARHENGMLCVNRPELNFTAGDSFYWPTLPECIDYTPWTWPCKCWKMLVTYSVTKLVIYSYTRAFVGVYLIEL